MLHRFASYRRLNDGHRRRAAAAACGGRGAAAQRHRLRRSTTSARPRWRRVRWCGCRSAARQVPGIVWRDGEAADDDADRTLPDQSLKPIEAALDALPPLPTHWLRLVEFTAAYYQRGIGEVALSVLPPELRRLDDEQLRRRIVRLRQRLASAAPSPAARRCAAAPAPSSSRCSSSWRRCFDRADIGAAATVLLHGSTGSGKTEVYLRAAAQALQRGRQALVLVPEINLTPQLEARFAERFAGRLIVSLHSGLTPAQRLRNWLAAHLGLADLVLGTRLAVFASLPRARPDRRRRGARPVVQAAGRRALFGARPGGLPRPARRRAGAARIGNAVAGELAARQRRALPAPVDAEPDRRRDAAGGAAGRPAAAAAAGRRRGAVAAAAGGDPRRGSRAASRACCF